MAANHSPKPSPSSPRILRFGVIKSEEDLQQRKPAGGARGLSLDSTLSNVYYESFRKVMLTGGQPRNREAYENDFLPVWVDCTGDPPLREIDNELLADFHDALLVRMKRGKRLTSNTILKHLNTAQRLLKYSGPRGDGPKQVNLDIIDRVPWTKPPGRIIRAPKNSYRAREIDDLVAVLKHARMPYECETGVPPADWWIGFVMLAWTTTLRQGHMRDRPWRDFRFDAVDDEGAPEPKLVLPPRIGQKGRQELVYFLPDYLTKYLNWLQSKDRTGVFFPWTTTGHHRTTLCDEWKRLVSLSTLPAHRRWSLTGIRKGSITEIAGINEAAARIMAGHTATKMTVDHYTNDRIAAEAQAKRATPDSFTKATKKTKAHDPLQGRLFPEADA